MIGKAAKLSVARQCALLGTSKSSCYYRLKRESEEELALLEALDRFFTEQSVYGSRRIKTLLERAQDG